MKTYIQLLKVVFSSFSKVVKLLETENVELNTSQLSDVVEMLEQEELLEEEEEAAEAAAKAKAEEAAASKKGDGRTPQATTANTSPPSANPKDTDA